MIITPFSCLMAVLWCDVFILFLSFLRRRTDFIMHFGLMPLLCLIVTTVLRLFLAMELPYTIVINDYELLRAVYGYLVRKIPMLGGEGFSAAAVLAAVWALVSVLFIVRLFISYRREKSVADALKKDASDEVVSALESAAGEKASVFSIARSADARVPYIIGFFRPVIVLPEIDYTEDELRLILTHETRHHFNRDPWVKLITNLLCYLMWWNLPVYVLKAQLDLTLELKCDYSVLKSLPEDMHERYFETILSSYKAARARTPERACALVRSSGTKQRFVLGLSYGGSGGRSRAYGALAVCVAVLMFAASYLFVLQPAVKPPATDEGGREIIASGALDGGYLVPNEDGTYTIMLNGQATGTIKSPSAPPFANMPIKEK